VSFWALSYQSAGVFRDHVSSCVVTQSTRSHTRQYGIAGCGIVNLKCSGRTTAFQMHIQRGSHISSEMAVQHALGLSEIVSSILQQVAALHLPEGPHCMLLYSTVNKIFAEECSNIIWQKLMSVGPLLRLPLHRRQHYANKVSIHIVGID